MHVKSSRRWLVAMLLVNLLLGIVVGILIDQFLLTPAEADVSLQTPAQVSPGARPRWPSKAHVVRRLTKELDLDESQEEVLSALFDQHRQTEAKFFAGQRARYKEIRQSFMTEVESGLTEDQVAKLRELRERMEHKRQEMRKKWKMRHHGTRHGGDPQTGDRAPRWRGGKTEWQGRAREKGSEEDRRPRVDSPAGEDGRRDSPDLESVPEPVPQE